MAKERQLDPCELWVVSVPDSHKEKIRRFGDAQEKIFSYYGQTNFWDFVGLNLSLVKILWANPLPTDGQIDRWT